jgi:hypothetical protein
MSNAHVSQMSCLSASLALVLCIGVADLLRAESPEWRAPKKPIPKHDASMVRTDPDPEESAPPQPASKRKTLSNTEPARRPATLARLIVNPDQTAGAPPYALTDQTGTVQRYVEPVPGIDIAAYVGQIVGVQNDTGTTLLASQLNLPRQPLQPLAATAPHGNYGPNGTYGYPVAAGYPGMLPLRPVNQYSVQQAQYIDNDDSSVQLLPEDMPMPGGGPQQLQMIGGYPGQMMPGQMCGPEGCGPQYCDPNMCPPGMMQPYAGPMVGPCPQCGNYHEGGQCESCSASSNDNDSRPHLYGAVDLLFFRPRFTEDAVGKLSETYELSPRFTLGVENLSDLGFRARYWLYGRDTNTLSGGDIRLELDVLDLEATHRIAGRRSQVDLSAGIRWANFRLSDVEDDQSSTDLLGLTMAADGLTKCLTYSGGYCGLVYGGRVSLLGGDWGGDDGSAFVDHRVRDDNMLVTELYAGAEIAHKLGPANVRARAIFEIQNWRSDALAQEADIESISLLGPGLQLGAEF